MLSNHYCLFDPLLAEFLTNLSNILLPGKRLIDCIIVMPVSHLKHAYEVFPPSSLFCTGYWSDLWFYQEAAVPKKGQIMER